MTIRNISRHDREILRDLAKKQAEIANSPLNLERKKLWYKHNGLQETRPIVLIETGPFIHDFVPNTMLKCESEETRSIEKQIRYTLAHFEFTNDDKVVDPYFTVYWKIHQSSYGVDVAVIHGTDSKGKSLGYVYDYPVKDIVKDFDKLRHRGFSVDREATQKQEEMLQDIFTGILDVKKKGYIGWTMGMTQEAIKLIGLENLMLYMYDEPYMLHRFLRFLLDDHILFLRWMEREGLLTLNNENDYVGSGTYGFCHDLPKNGAKNGEQLKSGDLWALIESQETVGISAEHYREFIFPYHREMAKQFGLVYYGCCEPVHDRWECIKQLPNLRSVSISPWCKEDYMSRELGKKYIYSRKPHPTLLSTGTFDEDEVRGDIKKTLLITKSNHVELIMKDLHTVNGDLRRIKRWVEIVREEIG